MQSAKYLEVISLTERVHRQFLELVKLKLDSLRIRNVNSRPFFNCEWHVKPWTSSLPGSRFFPRSVDAAA